jgi:hypothetical protein
MVKPYTFLHTFPGPVVILSVFSEPICFSRVMDKIDGTCSTNGEKGNAYGILVGKPEGKRPLGRPRSRWVDNSRMDLREVGWAGMDWIDLAQNGDRWRTVVNMVMNLRVQ